MKRLLLFTLILAACQDETIIAPVPNSTGVSVNNGYTKTDSLVLVRVPWRKPNGSSWDDTDGLASNPDVYVVIKEGEQVLFNGSNQVAYNMYRNQTSCFKIHKTLPARVLVQVYDYDNSYYSELMAEAFVSPKNEDPYWGDFFSLKWW